MSHRFNAQPVHVFDVRGTVSKQSHENPQRAHVGNHEGPHWHRGRHSPPRNRRLQTNSTV